MSTAVSTVLANTAVTMQRVSANTAAAPKDAPSESLEQNIQPLSPAIHLDPAAGVVVTEYYGEDGKVQTQIPSAAAVAYLRSGLTATGAPREKTEA